MSRPSRGVVTRRGVIPARFRWLWRRLPAMALRGRQLLLTTAIAVALGVAMIALKDVVLIHLH